MCSKEDIKKPHAKNLVYGQAKRLVHLHDLSFCAGLLLSYYPACHLSGRRWTANRIYSSYSHHPSSRSYFFTTFNGFFSFYFFILGASGLHPHHLMLFLLLSLPGYQLVLSKVQVLLYKQHCLLPSKHAQTHLFT